MQPVFHRQRIAGFARLMTAAALEMLARWEAETVERCDLADEMMRLTLAIVGRALFSIDLAREAHAVGPAFTTVNRHLGQFNLMLLLPFLPTRANRRFRKAVAELDQVVWRVIGERRKSGADGEDRGDLLSMLLAARDADTGEGMSDRQLRDEIITLMLAGYETTANALTWTFYLLAQNADAERRLHEEVDAVLGARPPEADDLPRLVWTRMVIEEAMRLYPPAWIVTRGAIEDDELAGHRIAAGSIVMASPWVTHRHPDFWPEPERFDPERFSPERAAGRHRYAYFPFGGGPRLCIGSGFAMTEAQLILATVAQRHRFRLEPGYRATPEPLITLRPRGGMPVTVERRA
jgi:cytochrome P450